MARDDFQNALIKGSGVTVRGQSGIIANIYKAQRNVKRNIQRATMTSGDRTKMLAQQTCPYDTGRMMRSITLEFTPERLAFDLFYDPAPFINEGVSYYPVYVELGTSRMSARPVLRPAWDAERPRYLAAIRAAIRRAT